MKLELSPGSPLVDLIDGFLDQIACLGLLIESSQDGATCVAKLKPRLSFIMFLIELLESVEFGQNTRKSRPFLFNRASWPQAAPLAGYLNPTTPVSWRNFFISNVNLWEHQSNSESGSSAIARVLRAALWMVQNEGWQNTLRFLFDVQRYGYFFESHAVYHALSTVLKARRRVPSDADIVPFLIDVDPAAGWLESKFRHPDLDELPEVRTLYDDLELIVNLAEDAVTKVKHATDLDKWVLSVAFLGDAARIAHQFLRDYDMKDTLAFAARWSQLEERAADAGAFMMMFTRARSDFPFAHNFKLYEVTVAAFRSSHGDGWRERFLEERSLLPNELVPLFLPDDEYRPNAVPEHWDLFSCTIAPIFGSCVWQLDHYQAIARSPELTTDDVQRRVRESMEAQKICDFDRALALLKSVRAVFPYLDFCDYEMAIVHDRAGQTREALSSIQRALLLNPVEPLRWHSFGIILKRLGFRTESLLAAAIHQQLKERAATDR